MRTLVSRLLNILVIIWVLSCQQQNVESADEQIDFSKVENGIHVATGLIDDEGMMAVIGSCTPCHSAKLITQNKATKDGWISMIRWMQAKQGLWDLGENEKIIVNYLAKNYAPEEKGRRANLEDIEWYRIE